MIKAFTLNRDDRIDRWNAYQQQMHAVGFSDTQLRRYSAYLVEDYENRDHLCEEASKDFPVYFKAQKGKTWPPYGHLVCTWGCLKAIRDIAEGSGYVMFSCDDYALKQKKWILEETVESLKNVNCLLLAYHCVDYVHRNVQNSYGVNLPKRLIKRKRSSQSRLVWEGTGFGSSENFVLSPEGAQLILRYMNEWPYMFVEPVVYWLYHSWNPKGFYSVVGNSLKEDGLVVMKKNEWITHLVDNTAGKFSDLSAYHDYTEKDNPNTKWTA